jgi:hypothetical protein
VTLGDYAAVWCAAQTFDETTREAVALRLRLHVVPQLGAYPLAALRPSVVQSWARGLQQQLAPSYVRVVFANLSASCRRRSTTAPSPATRAVPGR